MGTDSSSQTQTTQQEGEEPGPVARKPLGQAAFSVSARVAMQLGRESISSSITAIIELVKNAYDADAECVRIRFAGLAGQAPTMAVEDDGCGMTADGLRELWMVIGTRNKAKGRKVSAKGRVLTGEKGLGRLGLDRLCARTRVQSLIKDATEAVELDIDWSLYEESDQRLEEIQHGVYSLPHLDFDPLTGVEKSFPHGTRLVLEGLKDKWDAQAITALRRDLSLMMSPFAGPHDFVVEIDSGEAWKSVDGPVEVPAYLLEVAHWKVLATIDEAGMIEVTMNSRLHDISFRPEPAPWREFAKGLDETPACGPLRFEFYYFPRKEVSLAEQTLGRKDVDKFLDHNQGIRIYRDGFRVKPYGEPDGQGDWLSLAFRKMQNPAQVTRVGNWHVAYNQVIGAVFINRETNSALGDQTNREGLVDGRAFRDLRVFAKRVIKYFEDSHSKFMAGKLPKPSKAGEARRKAEEKAKESGAAFERLAAAAEGLSRVLPATAQPTASDPVAELRKAIEDTRQSVVQGQEAAEEAEKVTHEELEKTREEKNTMSNLASLGILAASFGHETLGLTDAAAKNALWLKGKVVSQAILLPPALEDEAKRVINDLEASTIKIETFAKFALDNVSPAKRRRKLFSLKALVNDVFGAFRDSLEVQRNIRVQLFLPENDECLIRAYPADWESVLVNFITNAVWSMEIKPKDQRVIRVRLEPEDNELVMTFEDSGRGLEANTEEQIFTPTFSTKRDEKGEVYGTGMGLTIVQSCIQENSGGILKALATGELGGAVFMVRVPRVPSQQK